ncbi:hypothetical protein G9C98_006488 [Cotesia typhae]|uniref:AP-3 complex subunit delta n=1 Tax=Cotesia typhae TaxID=2053667 RepID=A0A8J5VA37_9HYME|nr:hypothetical protein G9C98_006488 [Cotesia typhae]
MALRKVKGNFERMFDKNLTDLVRGIRNNKNNELQMLGYDISWAGFNIIEVMSSGKFTYKRIGYLAASQSFHMDTELLMLTTNMIRKDLNSQNQYDAGLALSGLSCFISPDLARDLVNDIMTLLTSTKPYLRKKAVLMMYKVFLRFPEALRPAFPRLKEKLEDPDSGVQSAAVNVVCELARKNPKNYLSLAPIFFKLMTTSTNNWMLIKIIKLFGALTPLEPRLGKKLIEPLTNLIHSTSAMSLLYECINTVIAVLISISSGMPNHSDSIQLCVQKLRILIEDSDQNLKYLGLLAMSKILKTHPKSVQAHKDLIMQCLDDKDESIRLRALDLLYGMVSKKNLMEIVRKLMIHMDKAEGTTYRDELLSKIIQICSQNNYQFITYFEWYISVLVDLTRMEGTKHGQLVATQLLDVAIRVQAIRKCAVQQCALLLENAHLLTGQPRATMCEVLYAAAWICGEFCSELDDPIATLKSMLKSQASSLPGHIQAVYVHNILKLAAVTLNKAYAENDQATIDQIFELKDKMAEFVCSGDLEVQERSSAVLVLFDYLKENPALISELAATFEGELNPVAPKAQKKVPIPEGLDLDTWINDPPSETSDEEDLDMNDIFVKSEKSEYGARKVSVEPTAEELQRRREARKLEQENNPHYLKTTASPRNSNSNSYHNSDYKNDDYDHIPIAELDIPVSLKVNSFSNSKLLNLSAEVNKKRRKKHGKKKKSKKNKNQSSTDDDMDGGYPTHFVNTGVGELPPGAELSDNDDNNLTDANDPHRALNIDLDIPLREDERLPVPEHRAHVGAAERDKKKSEKTKKKKKSKSKVSENENLNNIDLWLGNDVIDKENSNADDAELKGKPKRSKAKKKDEERRRKKKHDGKKQKPSGYEETAGISTPSKEILPGLTSNCEDTGIVNDSGGNNNEVPGEFQGYLELAGNDKVKMTYELKQLPHEVGRIIAVVTLSNSGSKLLKELDLDVSDASSLKLVRSLGEESGIKIRVPLAPSASTEVHLPIIVADDTYAQKLRGALTYMVENSGGWIQEKLDFTLRLSHCSFLMGSLSHSYVFTELLSGDQLMFKTKNKVKLTRDFSRSLEIICQRCHFTLVEQVGDNASLYGQSLKGHHVCLLVKKKSSENSSCLIIEGKGDNNSLLSGVVNEIIEILAN